MKEITRISLASLPYNVEVEAKKELEKYLHAIETALGADMDAMKEIEARIAELLADRGVSGEKVISYADVEAVKAQLGNPKDFADDSATRELGEEAVTASSERKMLRDTSDQVLGGVCSGLAAYAHIDTVWVRLGWVVLTIVTSGAMIPIYLIMWLVMPPAKTAAERLQMKGKPVTLEAIQEESIIVTKQKDKDKTALTIVRIIAGVGMLVIAAAAIMGLVSYGYHLTQDGQVNILRADPREQVYISAGFAAGICFIIFCFIIARMLFVAKASKRSLIKLGIVSAVGLASFATCVVGYGWLRYGDSVEYDKSAVVVAQDATAVAGAKTLQVNTNGAVVNYIVSGSTPKFELRYNTRTVTHKPTVRVMRSGEQLQVGAFSEGPAMCMGYCQGLVMVNIYGPSLDKMTVVTGSATYQSAGQKSFAVDAGNQTEVALKGDKIIEELTAVTDAADFATSDANVANVTMTSDAQSRLAFGNIAKLTLSAPTTCSNGTRLEVTASSAQAIIINGTAWQGHAEQTPCLNIAVGSEEL